MKYLYSCTLFISSFLLFLVQPMLAKLLLPYVGGVPSVWVVCMLFFQVLLLAGYAYAAFSSWLLLPLQQSVLHMLLYLLAILAALPFALVEPNNIDPVAAPERWLLLALLLTVGLPYFLLAANSSILQRWFYAQYDAEPYHLFSVSNLGSFAGLFAYPLVVERLFDLPQQMHYWGSGFVLIAFLFSLFPLLLYYIQRSRVGNVETRYQLFSLPAATIANIVLLAFIPSSLFLSVTLYITTDIASLPLLWVVPLALYLFSFVVVFAPWGRPWINIAQKLHPIILLIFIAIIVFRVNSVFAFMLHYICFLVVAISCHGRLSEIKPVPKKLTEYFFWVSFGGVLGGLFNVIAPHLFDDVYEYPLVIIISILALSGKHNILHGIKTLFQHKRKTAVVAVICFVLILLIWLPHDSKNNANLLHKERNFFGVYKVAERENIILLMHGTTLHGLQILDEQRRLLPTSYYTPVYNLLQKMPAEFFNKAMGVVGLGVGTAACYGREGQNIDFFEIDESVVKIANNHEYFTYLRDCPAEVNIYIGDGRMQLQQKIKPASYNLLVLDAFSSDSVPLHLLTKEAVQLYASRITPREGILAFNISNRYLSLAPFLGRIAKELGFESYVLFDKHSPDNKQPAENDIFVTTSQWLLMMPTDSPWREKITEFGFRSVAEKDIKAAILWTDEYSNIIPAIIW